MTNIGSSNAELELEQAGYDAGATPLSFPVVDPHQHIFPQRPPGPRPPLFAENFGKAPPRDGYVWDDLRRDAAAAVPGLVATVYVEAHSFYDMENSKEHLRSVGESVRIQQECDAIAQSGSGTSSCLIGKGIVCSIDLMLEEEKIEEAINEHLRLAKNVRAVRYHLAWDEDKGIFQVAKGPDVMKSEAFRNGLKLLEKHGLCFETFVFHTQLDDFAELAAAFPNLKIIFTAIPIRIRKYAENLDEVEAVWRQGILKISKFPNVFLKIGSLTLAMCGFFGAYDEKNRIVADSTAICKTIGPWYKFAIQAFGPSRCMFASNFPNDKTSCSYSSLWLGFHKIALELYPENGEVALRSLFYQTANEAYSLDLPVPDLAAYRIAIPAKEQDVKKEDIKKEDIKKEDVQMEDVKKPDAKNQDIKKEDAKKRNVKKRSLFARLFSATKP